MKKNRQKGSVTLFVLVAGLFFIIFLTSMFMLAAIERQAQIEATKQTQNIYSQGNANEIYQNYFTDSVIVPIYTKAQLFKMCTGEQIAINEEGGKIYTFNKNSIYLLKEDITFEYNGIWQMPSFEENGRVEGNGNTIKIKDTSWKDEFYYYYTDLNRYKKPLTEEGYLLSWDKTKVSATKVEESTIAGVNDIRIVPIPEGFVASQIPGEDTVEGGLVIYQGTEEVTGEKNSTSHNTAMETRNQFVWIPVDDVNQMVMCKSNTGTSICSLELQNGTLRCETHDSTDLCGRLYGMNSTSSTVNENTIYKTSMNFENRAQTWRDDSGYREPDILEESTCDNNDTTGNLATFTTQMTNDFVNMAESVAKYGGFYVSRYEAGENGESKKNQIVITAGAPVTTPTVYQGVNMWYGLYSTVRKTSTTMQSHMIYGSQYDQIINFIGAEAQTGHPGNVVTSQSKAGTKETDKLNNIYDLEGNNYEWTAQAYSTNRRIYRGGYYSRAGRALFHPSSELQVVIPTNANLILATRTALYFGTATVPIYTKDQLLKICSGEKIAINEEGGKIYTFSNNATYILKEDLTFEYNGIWQMPSFGEAGKIEGNGKTITIKDTSMQEEVYYYYSDVNEYKEPLTVAALSWDWSKVANTKLEKSTITGTKSIRAVPIPEGYVASQIPTEDTISEGLVIYQGTDQVTGDANSTSHTTAMTTRNQFVWIPVDDINQMVMCKSNTGTSVCSLALQTDGSLKCVKHNSTDLCGRKYETNNFAYRGQTWTDNSGYREPDILSDIDTTDNVKMAGITSGNIEDFKNQLTSDFKAMATSVAKYGGFYVSRYEAGANGASLKNQKALVAGTSNSGYTTYDTNTFINGNKWYGMYNTLKTGTAIDRTAVSSHMIWGSQYDMIIKYLEENSINEPTIGHSTRQLSTQELTGETTTDIMSNIYHLEGNNYEWTAEAKGTNERSDRGGGFPSIIGGYIFAAFIRDGRSPTSAACYATSRCTLYF